MQGDSKSDPPLVTQSCDEIHYVGSCYWKKRFGRSEWSNIYVVAHRQPQPEHDKQKASWTHVYRIVEDIRMGRSLVYLEAVLQGDCMIRGLAAAKQLIEIFSNAARLDEDLRRSTRIERTA
ncbi:hypothetical protein CIT25_00340 [Mesorhizobium mediterraneum]|uniref:Uncharacterized protein n=2 Tax=Mesorhizobium TaxID=68287 RepID=A0AB36RJR3_9HYPH|nr:hypothetical protein CIT25_00340 [Mesorhizobium mediterraneum]